MTQQGEEKNLVDVYMGNFTGEVSERLRELRKMMREGIIGASESISYGVPTYKINGRPVLYFAGFKNHVSIYPVTAAMEEKVKELSDYRTGKGTLQFPLKNPMPWEMIERIIKVRTQEVIG